MRTLKTVGLAGALVAAALVGGTLISAVFAASPAPSASTTDPSAKPGRLLDTKYTDAFLDKLASELGVERSAFGPATLAATNAAIDAAVAAGDIDAAKAATLKERLAKLEDPAVLLARPGFGHGPRDQKGPGPGRGFIRFGLGLGLAGEVDAAADALKLDKAALLEAVRAGKSLKEIAADQKVDYATVSTAILAVVKTHLAAEVTDKHLTQARSEALLERVTTWLAAGGDLPAGRWHR
jgi:hypothetical protein